ncbi:hypothetical protein V8D89_007041 [Ganoderma adspersum]
MEPESVRSYVGPEDVGEPARRNTPANQAQALKTSIGPTTSARAALRRAADTSGFNVLRLINEGSCSAIAYRLATWKTPGERNVLILDIGGGNTDASLVTIEEGIIEIKATEFKRKYNKDITGDVHSLHHLHIACQHAKHTLSTTSETTIAVNSICDDVDFYTSITRARFEELCQDLFRSTLEPIEKVLRETKIDKSFVHEIVLVGGSTRIPCIRRLVSDFFDGKEPAVIPPLDIETTVVCGAAIQAAILTGDTSEITKDMLLLDAIPHSLGIRTAGDVMTPLVKRTATIPTKRAEILLTTWDNQSDVLIEVYEGERARTEDNTLLGRLLLSGIPPAPRGVPQIEVTFDMNIDCHLLVIATAKDFSGSSSRQELNISSGRGGLSDAAMAEMAAAEIEVAPFETYGCDLRTALRNLEPALEGAEAWLESTRSRGSCAAVENYTMMTHWHGLNAAVRPVAELLAASEADSLKIVPEGAVVAEEAVRKWVEARLPERTLAKAHC